MEVIDLNTPLRGRITTASRRTPSGRRQPDFRAAAIAVANAINSNAGIAPEQVNIGTLRMLAHALLPMKHLL